MSRVSRRRALRDVSHQGSLGDPRRKKKERERKESKESQESNGEKREGCGEGDGAREKSGARSNDGDVWHPNGTGDGACLTLAGDPSPHTSPQDVISRNVTRQLPREQRSTGRASTHSIWGTCTLRGGVVEATTTCHRPIPFRRHTDSHPQRPDLKGIRHFAHSTTHHA